MRSRLAPLVVASFAALSVIGCSDASTETESSEPAATQPPSTTATTVAPTTTTKAPTTTTTATTVLSPTSAGDDIETAIRLIEGWAAGWNNDDVDAVAEVFAEEAIYACGGCHHYEWVGREDIRSNAPLGVISNLAFTAPVAVSADGVFTCAVEFLRAGDPFTADVEFEVGDGLVTRMYQVDERTDGDAPSDVRGSVGCGGTEVAPGDYEAVNDANGADQTYWTVVPESYSVDDPLPVYLFLAAGGGDADQNYAAWRPLIGDPEGLFVVANTQTSPETEVETYVGLIDQIGADYCVDLDHIHVIGNSWSAGLAAKLMCQMPETFASFADSIGSFGMLSSCEPTPKPLVAMTGDTDRPQVTVSVGVWAAINGCDAEPQAEGLGSGVTRYTYQGCDEDVILYDFEGMGHGFAATECIGPAGSYCAEYEDFDTFDTWEQFFAEHPLR